MALDNQGRRASRRGPRPRLAFNLVELLAVLVIVGLLAAAGVMRFGSQTVENLGAEGFARRLALDLVQARRRTIATGDNHFLQLAPSAANVTSSMLYRRTASGNVVVDQSRSVPAGVTCSASHSTLEFDFDGTSLAAYSVSVAGPNRIWTVSTVMATGSVRTDSTP